MPSDPTLYLYTSLTAGSSHIITATSRIETILKANKIPFKAVDCATDDKARMLWARRSKGRKIPGLVKFNDVIADLEQVEEWNEYGELEEQIEDQIDLLGDVPISATVAEAQAVAAARAQASASAQSSSGRTASETRHISISDPKDEKAKKEHERERQRSAAGMEKTESPLSMAMRQAGAEAAAKAGQKRAAEVEVIRAAVKQRDPADLEGAASLASVKPKLDLDSEEPTKVDTAAKTPEQLASEGAKRTSVEKITTPTDDTAEETKSTEAQIIDQRRKSSVPQQSSSLAKSTSIDDAHTVTAAADKASPESSRPDSNEQGGATVHSSDAAGVKQVEETTPATKGQDQVGQKQRDKDEDEEEEEEEEEEDDDDDDDDDEEDDEEEDDEGEEEEEVEEKERGQPVKKAAKVAATDKAEEAVLRGSKPQEEKAADGEKASRSVGD